MAERLLMMALSPTMSEGTIARWRVAEGQAFKAGALLCEVETDKASMDYEAPKDAVLLRIVLPEGGKAAVGDAIAIIGAAGEDPTPLLAPLATPKPASVSPNAAPAVSAPAQAKTAASVPPPSPPKSALEAAPEAALEAGPERPSASVFALSPGSGPSRPASYPPSSPLARSLARDLGVDLRAARGSGPGGRVVEKDVRALALASEEAGSGAPEVGKPAPDKRIPISGKRAVIARRLSESFYSAPHYYLKRRADAAALLALREASRSGRDKPISLNALLIKLSAEAIVRHPYVNSSWEGDSILERGSIDIGLAVALDDGLVTPVVRDCARKGAAAIEDELGALIAKAKGRGLAPPEYEGASFTISNLGGYGIEEFTAIINPPGSAILAAGAILDEPIVARDGSLSARKAMALTLGCDHRVIDGAAGSRFLATLVGFIEAPGSALL
jgi:pyruvate dehydrogenase E2 component (dihydrolipoamide acetyltransferase)